MLFVQHVRLVPKAELVDHDRPRTVAVVVLQLPVDRFAEFEYVHPLVQIDVLVGGLVEKLHEMIVHRPMIDVGQQYLQQCFCRARVQNLLVWLLGAKADG